MLCESWPSWEPHSVTAVVLSPSRFLPSPEVDGAAIERPIVNGVGRSKSKICGGRAVKPKWATSEVKRGRTEGCGRVGWGKTVASVWHLLYMKARTYCAVAGGKNEAGTVAIFVGWNTGYHGFGRPLPIWHNYSQGKTHGGTCLRIWCAI